MDVLEIERVDGARDKISLRRFVRGNRASQPERVAHEYRVLQFLETTDIPAPRPLLLDADGALFGVPAIALTYLPGRPLYRPRDADSWTRQLAEALLRVHAVTPRTHDLSWLHVHLRDGIHETLDRDRTRAHDHSALAQEAHTRLVSAFGDIDWLDGTFVHDDYWPGNTIWYRGRLTGVIDWTFAEVGDPRSDVAQCRLDLALINGVDVSDAFLEAYRSLAPQPLPQVWFFDLLRGLHALLSYQFWFTGYQDARLADMTERRIRTGIEAFLGRALDEGRGIAAAGYTG
jgi:aminoglycoside phosphotransferase (APT) family kinase protein